MVSKLSMVLTTIAMIVVPATAQTLPGSGITKKSIPFSGAVYSSATREYVDISGSLNVVRTIRYGQDANGMILLSELAPSAMATGRSTGTQYCSNGAVALARQLPPGLISDAATVRLSFPLYPCSGTETSADLVEYTLVLQLVALAISIAQAPQ